MQMKIRASVLTPILAMLTVVALIATGIALGQSRSGDASATLLDSTPSLAAAAEPDTAAVADAGLPNTGGASLEEPVAQSVEVVQSVSAGPVIVAGGQRPATTPRTTPPTAPPTAPPTTPPTAPPTAPPTTQPTTHQDAPDPPVTETGDDGSVSDEPAQPHQNEETESDSD
jgi:hypothetical protein